MHNFEAPTDTSASGRTRTKVLFFACNITAFRYIAYITGFVTGCDYTYDVRQTDRQTVRTTPDALSERLSTHYSNDFQCTI
jgi:hypothetical protein